jgi:hypothetical protein
LGVGRCITPPVWLHIFDNIPPKLIYIINIYNFIKIPKIYVISYFFGVTAASGETLTIFLPEYIFSNQEQFCDALRIGDYTHSLEVHYVHVINEFGQQTILSKLMMIVWFLRDI